MGKTTYTVNRDALAKLMMALAPAPTVSASYDFLTAGAEITRDMTAPVIAPQHK